VSALIIFWQFAENLINARRLEMGLTGLEAFIPSPITIFKTFSSHGNIILVEISHTLRKAFLGCFLGVIIAFFMSIFFLIVPISRNILLPFTFAINSFPIVGIAPAIILAFGQGSWGAIVFISALISYFPVLISMDTAFKETDQEVLDLMYVFNASAMQTFFKVRLPVAVPYFFLSLKLAIPASIIGATMGEWLGCRVGIGQLITISLYQLKPGLLYASLISIVVVSILSILCIKLVEYFCLPWKR